MSRAVDLSIVVPAYQEAKRIAKSLTELEAWLSAHDYGVVEVVVVTADSPDGTADIVRKHAKRFEHFQLVEPGPRVGKGRDVRAGMRAASGKIRLFMDADLATPLVHIDEAVAAIEAGADIAIAVRNLTSSHTGMRRLLSGAGNALVQTVLLPGIKDTQCGFKAFRAEVVEPLFSRQTILGWGFDMELLAIARAHNLRITTIPAPDWSDQPDGTFEGQVGSAALRTLADLARITALRMRGAYKPTGEASRG